MAKAWGHSRSGTEGLRPDLISALAGGSVSNLFSASSAKPQSRCAAASAYESSALVGGAERSYRSWWKPTAHEGRRLGLEVTELLLLLGIKPPLINQLLTLCCHQWKAVYKMKTSGTVAV